MQIALDARPVRAERVVAQRSVDTLILLNPSTGEYYTLDEVGARVWELCDGSRCVTDVVSTIHDEYDAPLESIQLDVVELLDDLAGELLVSAA